MGFLKNITRLFRSRAAIQQLPVGSLTVDRDGRIITSTVSSAYPKELLGEIGRAVLALFRCLKGRAGARISAYVARNVFHATSPSVLCASSAR